MSIQQVIAQLEAERSRIDAALKALKGLNPNTTKTAKNVGTRKKRVLSAAGRAKIAAAQKARWADVRKGKKGA